jgi:molecular chaperone DnaJ
MAKDLYELLEVARDAAPEDIKSAYRRLARKYHPDVNKEPDAEDRFKEISQAYAVLSDPERRAQYDRFGTVEEMPNDPFFGGQGNFGDIFEMFFGGMGQARPGRRSSAQHGSHIETSVTLTLLEVLTGARKRLDLQRMVRCDECGGTGAQGGAEPEKCPQCEGEGAVARIQQTFLGTVRTATTCPTCSGAGTVIRNACPACRGRKQVRKQVTVEAEIPPGVDHGATLRVAGEGHEGLGGGQPGDLYVALLIQEDPRFERDGNDLHTSVQLTFAQAALGDQIEVPGVETTHEVEVPQGTQPGEALTIRAAGLPQLHGGRRGDLHVHVRVTVPDRINDAQREKILELARELGEPIPKGSKGGGLLGNLFRKKK